MSEKGWVGCLEPKPHGFLIHMGAQVIPITEAELKGLGWVKAEPTRPTECARFYQKEACGELIGFCSHVDGKLCHCDCNAIMGEGHARLRCLDFVPKKEKAVRE